MIKVDLIVAVGESPRQLFVGRALDQLLSGPWKWTTRACEALGAAIHAPVAWTFAIFAMLFGLACGVPVRAWVQFTTFKPDDDGDDV